MPPKRKPAKPSSAPTNKAAAAAAAAASAAKAAAKKPSASASASTTATKNNNKTPAAPAANGASSEPAPDAPPEKKPPLPGKDAAVFKNTLKLYENKQHKKGLKDVDAILKKFPEHGESHSMRGLFLSELDRKPEAYDEALKGTQLDPGSHMVWHIQGLVYRKDKDYTHAIECYKKALSIDAHNVQILRDLSIMQISLRDFEGYRHTRSFMVRLFRGAPQRIYLISAAVGSHLLEDFDLTLKFLDLYMDTYKPHPPPRNWEFSEVLMYRNQVLAESGALDAALSNLDAIEGQVCDPRWVREKRAEYLLGLGRNEPAMEAYVKLLHENPDHRGYIEGLIAASGERACIVLEGLVDDYKKSHLMQAMLLVAADADSELFDERLAAFLEANVARGVPSTLTNLTALYEDPAKCPIIERHLLRLLSDPPAAVAASADAPMWLEMFLAQHYDRLADYPRAMHHIGRAISAAGGDQEEEGADGTSRNSTALADLLLLQARIIKHTGDVNRARDVANAMRETDLKDRYLNTKCTKYMLRAGSITEAEETIKLFARPDMADPLRDLVEMQCQWFMYESGAAHARAGRPGPALKRFEQIMAAFRDYQDDQFDFHSYSLRKTTLRAYVEMVDWAHRVRAHPYFTRTARAAILENLRLADRRERGDQDTDLVQQIAEAQDAVAVAKKAIAKKKKELAQGKDTDKDKYGASTIPDADPLGLTHLMHSDPVEAAHAIVKLLQQAAPKAIETHVLALAVDMRQASWAFALRDVRKMVSVSDLGADAVAAATVHASAMALVHAVQTREDVESELRDLVVKGVRELLSLDGEDADAIDVEAQNELFVERSCGDGTGLPLLASVAAAAHVALVSGNADRAEALVGEVLGRDPRSVWGADSLKRLSHSWELIASAGGARAEELAQRIHNDALGWVARA
ncbi:NMDA receptor-regulated protein 1-domain-containing protein [Blastocladiella britannica]|nr:NMDA receptor-regulated protein 1-domain-containing protein [Blastocladiella britannica]